MAHTDTLTTAATASAGFAASQVRSSVPDEWPALPGFAVGDASFDPDRQSKTFYEAPATYEAYLVQKNSDGEAALDTLRDGFLTQLFAASDGARWIWIDSRRFVLVWGGVECRVEAMQMKVQEQLDFI